MARICNITGKKTAFGNKVSNSNRKSKRTFKSNLITKNFFIDGTLINLKISCHGLRIINKLGIEKALKKFI